MNTKIGAWGGGLGFRDSTHRFCPFPSSLSSQNRGLVICSAAAGGSWQRQRGSVRKGTLGSWVCLAELDTSGDDVEAGRKAQVRWVRSRPAEDSTGITETGLFYTKRLISSECSVLSWTKGSQPASQPVSGLLSPVGRSAS